MEKLKQHLPPGVFLDNDLFLSMFLIRLLPSMREAVGAGTHKTAAAMMKTVDALSDARGSHDPTVAAAWTQRSRSPAPSSGKRGNKRSSNSCSKSLLPFADQSHHGLPLCTWYPKKMDRGNYRHLNLMTTPDKYPLPNMQDFSSGLHGCNIFSKINLAKGYHQIPVATEDIPKTAIKTPFGFFEYLFTPFGLSNAAQTFLRMID